MILIEKHRTPALDNAKTPNGAGWHKSLPPDQFIWISRSPIFSVWDFNYGYSLSTIPALPDEYNGPGVSVLRTQYAQPALMKKRNLSLRGSYVNTLFWLFKLESCAGCLRGFSYNATEPELLLKGTQKLRRM